ncbi:MAG: hypothetical protein U0470_13205 [Anaerolineae bacterium]
MSNATQEFSAFIQRTKGIGGLNPRLVIVDGAQGELGAAAIIKDPSANFWKVVDQRLQAAGVTAQVQALWVKEADAGPTSGFPAYAQTLADELGDVIRLAASRFPNAQLAYFSSRTYGGYASTTLNPEPYAYESAFSVQWLIRRQIDGDAALNADAPPKMPSSTALLWGRTSGPTARRPRGWAVVRVRRLRRRRNPPVPRRRPAEGGRAAGRLLPARSDQPPVVRRQAGGRPAAAPGLAAGPDAGPTATPGGATPTPLAARPTPTGTPGATISFRVRERPSGDMLWVWSTNVVVRRQPHAGRQPRRLAVRRRRRPTGSTPSSRSSTRASRWTLPPARRAPIDDPRHRREPHGAGGASSLHPGRLVGRRASRAAARRPAARYHDADGVADPSADRHAAPGDVGADPAALPASRAAQASWPADRRLDWTVDVRNPGHLGGSGRLPMRYREGPKGVDDERRSSGQRGVDDPGVTSWSGGSASRADRAAAMPRRTSRASSCALGVLNSAVSDVQRTACSSTSR